MTGWFRSRRALLRDLASMERRFHLAQRDARAARMEAARWQERAETVRRMEDDAWHLATTRGDQLRERGVIPAGFPS